MSFVHLLRISSVLVMLLLAQSRTAHADSIVLRDKKIYGTITAITNSAVTIREGCNGRRVTVAWADLEYVTVDQQCGGPQVFASSSPVTAECGAGDRIVMVTAVSFKPRENRYMHTYAASISYREGEPLVLTLPNGLGIVQGPLQAVELLERSHACSNSVGRLQGHQWPNSYARQ